MLSFHRVVHGLMVHRLRSFSTVLPRRAQEVKAWVDEVVLQHNFCFKAARFTSSFLTSFLNKKTGSKKMGLFKRGLFLNGFFFEKLLVAEWDVGVSSKVGAFFSFGVMRFCFIRILADPCKTKGVIGT